tara:strand:- start:287 stop:1144 length:858 start_codon:yes stop_codon:yes gene_type:complete
MTTILTKKKDSSGVPATADITSATGGAELAVNTADKRLYTKNSSNVIVEVGTNPGSLNLNADLTNTSGNLVTDPATKIFEIKGGGSTDGAIQVNCRNNSHGQRIKAQPHSEEEDNTMLMPKGADSTLVSEVGTATLTNKTLTSPTINGATIDTAVKVSAAGTLGAGGAITGASTVSDQDGDLRDIPVSQNLSGNYTLAIGDAGNQITINTSNAIVTVPTGVFGVGDIISVVSVNGCTASLACTAVNAVKAGDLAATALHTLDANGVASIMFTYTADLAVLTGNIS